MSFQQGLNLILKNNAAVAAAAAGQFGRWQYNSRAETAATTTPTVSVPAVSGFVTCQARRHVRAGPWRDWVLQQGGLETVQMVLVIHTVGVDDLHGFLNCFFFT